MHLMSPELPTPLTPDAPDLPVEPDQGPATPVAPPPDTDTAIPAPTKPAHAPTLMAWRGRVSRHFMCAAAFRWRMV